jgi:quinol monooxygenase YgiN
MALSSPKPVFILNVTVTIDPAKVSEFLIHLRKAYDLAIAEPECLYFIVGQSSSEPGVFSWTEGWAKDTKWFMEVR